LAGALWILAPPALAHPNGTPTPLTSIAADSNLDAPADPANPGTGGAFDNSSYFRNRLTSTAAIAACAAKIEAAAAAWAGQFALMRSGREAEPTSLILDYQRAGLRGLFEVAYKVDLGTHARVTVNFYGQDGSQLDPATIQTFLKTYDIAQFEDALDIALRCGGQGA
jgi:hypothetical protein